MNLSSGTRASAVLLLLALPPPAASIVIRHDRDDTRYLKLATAYSQVVHMNTQEPGKPPDGEGTLVASRWVLTAAHIATLIKPGHPITVSGRDYSVARVHIHPQWTDGPNDIALVMLSTDVSDVDPALLYSKRDESGKVVTVVGIGDTGNGLTGPTTNDGKLRAATNRIDSATDAWLKFGFDQGDKATDLEGIGGPGDSGGPAFLDTAQGRCLVGVGSGQSTRATGGREGRYGVTEYYARVSSYVGWLESVMSQRDSSDAPPNPSLQRTIRGRSPAYCR